MHICSGRMLGNWGEAIIRKKQGMCSELRKKRTAPPTNRAAFPRCAPSTGNTKEMPDSIPNGAIKKLEVSQMSKKIVSILLSLAMVASVMAAPAMAGKEGYVTVYDCENAVIINGVITVVEGADNFTLYCVYTARSNSNNINPNNNFNNYLYFTGTDDIVPDVTVSYGPWVQGEGKEWNGAITITGQIDLSSEKYELITYEQPRYLHIPLNFDELLATRYEVTFVYRNSDGEEESYKTSVKEGEDAIPPENIDEWPGHSFTGWDSDFTNVTQDITVTAEYIVNKFTVTFIVDGEVSDTEIVSNGDSATDWIPLKTGHAFDGWYTNDSYIDKYDFNSEVTSDFSLYGTFNIETYNITYKLNGGINNPDNPDEYTVDDTPVIILDPSRAGYNFVKWVEGDVIAAGETGDKTFTAVWSDAIVYYITYELDEGVNHADNPDYYTVVDTPIEIKAPTKAGYNFVKWVEGDVIAAGETGDKTFTAVWSAPIVYNITYVLDDGTNDPSNPSTYTIESETIILKDASKDGYSFEGWTPSDTIEQGSFGDKEFTATFKRLYIKNATIVSWNKNLQDLNNQNLRFTVELEMSDGTTVLVNHAEKVNGQQKGNKTFEYSYPGYDGVYNVYAAWNDNNMVTACEIRDGADGAGGGSDDNCNENDNGNNGDSNCNNGGGSDNNGNGNDDGNGDGKGNNCDGDVGDETPDNLAAYKQAIAATQAFLDDPYNDYVVYSKSDADAIINKALNDKTVKGINEKSKQKDIDAAVKALTDALTKANDALVSISELEAALAAYDQALLAANAFLNDLHSDYTKDSKKDADSAITKALKDKTVAGINANSKMKDIESATKTIADALAKANNTLKLANSGGNSGGNNGGNSGNGNGNNGNGNKN